MGARIVCTVGPACESAPVLRAMIEAGMDVARFNFSHGTHADHARRMRLVREAARRAKKKVRILQDLAGYRIRIGRLAGGSMELRRRQTVWLTNLPGKGRGSTVPFDYAGPLDLIGTGKTVYIDDGNIALVVKGRTKDALKTEVIVGGTLRERKGVNMPGVRLRFEGVTPKDEEDLAFGAAHRVDDVAQSFVRDVKDVEDVRRRLGRSKPRLIAKIESSEGLCNLDGILRAADGVMVARGDLGVSIPIHEIPMVQKMIIRRARLFKRFTITATQMLESMIENPRPTRAEVSDVANAILDGTDYVMLSGETAAGRYPVETVRMMRLILDFTERTGPVTRSRYCRLIF